MADKEVKITLTIDGIDKEVKNVEELQSELGKLNKKTQEAEKSQGFFAKKLDEAKQKLNDIKSSLGDLGKGYKILQSGLTKVASGFGLSSKAASGFGKAASAAIAATGIGLLIPLVISLVNYFKNLEGGAKALKKIMAGLGAIVSNVGKALSLLVKGEFSAAFNTLKDAVVEATEAVDNLYDAEKKLSELRQKTIIENAKLNQEIEKQKKILEDGTLSVEERLAALDKVTAATKKLAQNQKAETQEALRKAQSELTLINNFEERREKQEEIAELQAQLIDQTTQLSNIEYDAAKVAREIRQAEADEKAAQAKEDAARREEEEKAKEEAAQKEIERKARLKEILDQMELDSMEEGFAKAQAELEAQEMKALAELDALNATEEEKQKVREYYGQKRKQLVKDQSDFEIAMQKATQQANAEAYSAGLSAISRLVGENTAFGKAAAIASTTIDTYVGAQKAYASQLIVGDPTSPVRAAIAAGVAVANGLANVKAILSTKTPGDAAAPATSTPSQPNIRQFNPQGALGAQQAGEIEGINTTTGFGAGAREGQPVRAYVIATEVSTAQEANKKIDDLARL
jgi:hypothetical protein